MKKIFLLSISFIVTVSIILTVVLINNTHDIRQKASYTAHPPQQSMTYTSSDIPQIEKDYTEEDLATTTSTIQKQIIPENDQNFIITPDLMALLQKRRAQMYYFAAKNPDIFLKHILPNDIRALLPVQFIEETDLGTQGVYIAVGKKHGTITSHDTHEVTTIYFPSNITPTIKTGDKVFIYGVKVADRLVVPHTENVTHLTEFMAGH